MGELSWQELTQFLASLPSREFDKAFLKDFWTLRRVAQANKSDGEALLCIVVESLLRSNVRMCAQAGIMLRDCIDLKLISPEAALNVLERWERNPVIGFEPNLGASVYEHLLDGGAKQLAFERWKSDAVLSKRYAEATSPSRDD